MTVHRFEHRHGHAFTAFNALTPEGLTLFSRRNLLKASLAGIAGLSLPGLLRQRAEAARAGEATKGRKSVILLWMTGGPSHIDIWDPKPDRPIENRGYLLVAHPLQPDEQDDRALLLREPGDRALQVSQLEPLTLLRRAAQHRLGFI